MHGIRKSDKAVTTQQLSIVWWDIRNWPDDSLPIANWPGCDLACLYSLKQNVTLRIFPHWLHRELSKWQLSEQPVTNISSKWWEFALQYAVDMLITKEGDQCLLTNTSIIKQSRAVGTWSSMARYWVRHCPYGLLARYVKLRVAHASGMPGMFSPPPRVSDPGMHHGTCVTHVPSCMPGSLTSGFLWSRWRGKRYRHCRCMRNPQFYVSGKRPIDEKHRSDFEQTSHSSPSMGCLLWVFWEKINRDIKVVRILFLNWWNHRTKHPIDSNCICFAKNPFV